jgi:hypothetical protein
MSSVIPLRLQVTGEALRILENTQQTNYQHNLVIDEATGTYDVDCSEASTVERISRAASASEIWMTAIERMIPLRDVYPCRTRAGPAFGPSTLMRFASPSAPSRRMPQ